MASRGVYIRTAHYKLCEYAASMGSKRDLRKRTLGSKAGVPPLPSPGASFLLIRERSRDK